ncbi:unnamed protein product [Ostreobium quekettii]|uniref:FAD-binding PCMH-type domain-containing protein n=1 Tax=Ostreobium quekettii TaxID=121088 RepID=A0A8S1IXJ8_9CHLO|nr:unnamed protein product [Ostreobium quekettii]
MVHGRGAVATGRWRRLAVLCLALFLAWACVNFFLFPPAVQSPAHASRSIHTSPILLNKGTWETGPGEALCANEASICEHREALENLRGTIRGQVLCKGMDVYTLSARVFNALRDKEPGVVVRPLTVEDIKAALQAAANFNMTVTVKCGGHNPAGLATNDCGMLIDMYYMRGVHWDSDLHIIAEGGALWKHVHPLLAEANRSIVGGGCPDVGVVGLVVGGGVGWTSRSHGLAADNVLEATVVLPNSTVVTVDTDNQPDLFWALKGAGGSNFGVVASVKLRTFPAHDHYFAGQFCFHRRENDTADVLRVHGKVLQARDMDDRLTVDLFSSRHPPGEGDGDGYLPIRMCYGLFFDGPIDEALVIAKGVLEDLSTLVDEETACR